MRRAVQTFGVWEKTERATQQCEYCKLWFAKVDARHYRTCIFIPGEERSQKLAWLEELKKDRKRVAERERYARKRKLAGQMITPNNTVPQKRGRGRPRKNPVANTSVNSTNTNNVQGGSVPFVSDSSLVHEPGNQLNRTVGSHLNPNLNLKPAPTPYHTPMQHNVRYDIPSEMPFDEIRDDGSGYECVQDSMDEEQDKEPPLDSGEQQRKIANWLEILATNTDKIVTSADRSNQLIESLIESTIQGFGEMKRLVREGQGQSD
eukprot:jgi/Picre1/33790/NNA_001269.t1